MKFINYHEGQAAESLYFDTTTLTTPAAGKVQLQVAAFALNRADILQRLGKYPVPKDASPILGLEVAGTVVSIGKDVDNCKVGDKVCCLVNGGAYAEYVNVDAGLLIPMPKELSFAEAAAIPEAFLVAYHCLYNIGQLQPDESVLIHAAASGIGTAAIQLARLLTAHITTTCSTSKIADCQALGATTALDYQRDVLADTLAPNSIDVVLDMVGSTHFDATLNSLRPQARWAFIALLGGGKAPNFHLGKLLFKQIKMQGFMLRPQSMKFKRQLVEQFNTTILPHFKSGKLKPVIHQTLPWQQINEAHQILENNTNVGKVVMKVEG